MAADTTTVTVTSPPSPTDTPEALASRWSASMLANYGTPAICIDRGSGCEVFDTDGRRYLDFVAGIAVSSLGHAHPAVVQAVTTQIAKVAHTSNLYAHDPGLRLAARLQSFVPTEIGRAHV